MKHMNAGAPAWFDAPEIASEFLSRTGLIDPLLRLLFRAAVALPLAIARWLGPDLRTHQNSSAPTITFGEPGQWSGCVMVRRNQASAWLLLKVEDGAPIGPTPTPYGPTREPVRPTRPLWSEEEELDPGSREWNRWGGSR